MATEEDILAALTGKKVFDGKTWRVYDEAGAELTTGGALWRGVHGALLWGANQVSRLDIITYFRRLSRR